MYFPSLFANRIVFSFDPADMKAMSNEALDQSLSLDNSSSSVSGAHQRPISSTDIVLKRKLSDVERRYSAPPVERKGMVRDSVGSIDYLSDAPGEWRGRRDGSDEGEEGAVGPIDCLSVNGGGMGGEKKGMILQSIERRGGKEGRGEGGDRPFSCKP